MNVLIYQPDLAERTVALCEALVQGFIATGDEVDIETSDRFKDVEEWPQLVCLIGHNYKNIWRAYNRAGRHVLLVDEAYIYPRRYYRFALDGWQTTPSPDTEYDLQRFFDIIDKAGIDLLPERAPNVKNPLITYVGVSTAFAEWHELGNALDFDRNQIRTAAAHAMGKYRDVLYHCQLGRPEALWIPHKVNIAINPRPLQECIETSQVVIGWAQPALVQAAIMGVPIVDTAPMEISPLTPWVERDPMKICSPRMIARPDRLRMLTRVAHNQFTLAEIASGQAMELLAKRTIKRLEAFDPDSAEHVIEQYKIMHDQPKRYRGRLPNSFVHRIAKLVKRHGVDTMLDYGSGKGRQYGEMKQHLAWGPTPPTCYDPGYLPLSKKPVGMFGGVICTDVAEHLPTPAVDGFLKDVIGYASKFVFFCIFTDPATKSLPDGRNAHLTVQPPTWWNDAIGDVLHARFPGKPVSGKQLDDETWQITCQDFEVLVVYQNSKTTKETD